jgi:hypothetical protein
MSMSNVNAIFLSCLVLFTIVAMHTANGQELLPTGTWGSHGLSNGNFKSPSSVTVDSADNVYVADTGNNRIQKFSENGTFITKWGEYGTANGSFSRPFGVVADPAGNVYVADTGNNRIQKFSGNGTFITDLGKYGINSGNFKSPSSVTVDSAGNVYVADTGNNRIQKFSENGTFITKWGKYGSNDQNFRFPSGVMVQSSGYAFVADTGNNRIKVFDTNSITDSVSTRMPSVTQTKNMSTVNLGGPNIPIPKEPNNKTSSERVQDGRKIIDDKFLTYMNASYGIRIQYPQNWTIKDNYRLNPDDPYITIVSFFAPPEKNITSPREEVTVYVDTQQYRTSLEEYMLEPVLNNNNTQLGKWKNVSVVEFEENSTLAERPAYKVELKYIDEITGSPVDRYLLDTGTVVEDKVYVVSYWAEPQTYSELLPDVEKMVDSFEILDTIDSEPISLG